MRLPPLYDKFTLYSHVQSLTLQYSCLTTGWRTAPTKTTSSAGKWKLWSAQTSKNNTVNLQYTHILYTHIHTLTSHVIDFIYNKGPECPERCVLDPQSIKLK